MMSIECVAVSTSLRSHTQSGRERLVAMEMSLHRHLLALRLHPCSIRRELPGGVLAWRFRHERSIASRARENTFPRLRFKCWVGDDDGCGLSTEGHDLGRLCSRGRSTQQEHVP